MTTNLQQLRIILAKTEELKTSLSEFLDRGSVESDNYLLADLEAVRQTLENQLEFLEKDKSRVLAASLPVTDAYLIGMSLFSLAN